MIFPDTPRETYRHNPLKEVICQLRFPTILRVQSEPPAAFQEQVRNQYPLYTNESPTENLPKEINQILAGVMPAPLKQSVHKFETEDRKRLISLSHNFLALSEKVYTRWSDFRREMECAERAIRDVYQPSFYDRIGLRYRDVIDREPLGLQDRPWEELLNATLLGLLAADEARTIDIRTQAVVRLPDPIQGCAIISHGFMVSDNKQVYLLDSDFFIEERREPGNAFTILDDFNRLAARFFRWAISPLLRDAMGPTPID